MKHVHISILIIVVALATSSIQSGAIPDASDTPLAVTGQATSGEQTVWSSPLSATLEPTTWPQPTARSAVLDTTTRAEPIQTVREQLRAELALDRRSSTTAPTPLGVDDVESAALVAEVPASDDTSRMLMTVSAGEHAAAERTATTATQVSADEVARMQMTIAQAQNRMSRARVAYRLQEIAVAEQALKEAQAQLAYTRNAQPTAEEIALVQQTITDAEATLQARIAEQYLVDPALQTTFQTAQDHLNALSVPVDAATVAAAEQRVAVAQADWQHVAGTASARKTEAEVRWQDAVARVTQAKADFQTAYQRYQTALSGIDPLTGLPLDANTAQAHQQRYAEEATTLDRQCAAAEEQVAPAWLEYEAARQQEIGDVAAAQRNLDQANADLHEAHRGPSAEAIAQARADLDAARAALAEAEQRANQSSRAVAGAQTAVDQSRTALEAELQGDHTEAIEQAEQRVLEAEQKLASARRATVDTSGWAWPTYGTITSGFGPRNMTVGQNHNGVDIAGPKGTPIAAARTGTVIEAGWCAGYGYCVKIAHANGFGTEYGHLASAPIVAAGQAVDAGAIIGYMGTTYDAEHGGYSTGVHLHFTLKRNGGAVDPLRYLP